MEHKRPAAQTQGQKAHSPQASYLTYLASESSPVKSSV